MKQKQRARSVSAFQRAYAALNDAQKLAVEAIEGPVLVCAGPGTGKTQVLALRTANILKKTHAKPSNILCLTFSVAGTSAMRERLRALIGADAYGITINTVHGFCNDVIQRYPLAFEEFSAASQVSDLERYRIVNKIIDQLLPDLVVVNRKVPYLRTRQILGRIAELKREGMTDPAKLNAIADQYEEEMSTKSKGGTKAHERNLLQARKFRELLKIFSLYQLQLRESQRYDYEDMILFVIQCMRREDWLLPVLQEQYQYILVDEFQDLNGAQVELIQLLTTDPTGDDSPNLFAVGDDDQSIYRFQGASVQNILTFKERFPKAPVIPLTISYRCSQQVLDASSKLIVHNEERLVGKIPGLTKDLESATKKQGESPVLLFTPSDVSQPWMIADLIEERLKQGMELEDIALLVQTNRELVPLYEVLRARDISVEMNGKIDLLGSKLVAQVVSILKAICNPSDNAKLASALACECFDVHPADLGRVFQMRRNKRIPLREVLLNLETEFQKSAETFYDFIGLIATRNILIDLHQKLASRTIVDTVEHVMRDAGLLNQSDRDPLDLAPLQEFFDRVKQRAYEQPGFSLEHLLADLKLFEDPEYGDVRMTYDLPHLSEHGVQLMTAHQSKGLEFRTVLLVNFRDGHWSSRRNPPSLAVPEDLLFGRTKDEKKKQQIEDERRVAYVAITRAKEEVIFVCPTEVTSGDRTRSVSPSQFIAEVGEIEEVHRELKNPLQTSTLLLQPKRELDAELQSHLRSRLEKFRLSVTALNHFLEDPERFLEEDLLLMPQPSLPVFSYGSAVHSALNAWALKKQGGNPMTKEEFLAAFRTHLEEREILTDTELGSLIATGEESLPRYYDIRLKDVDSYVFKVEYPISTHIDDPSGSAEASIPVKGLVDRIDLDAPESAVATIIDYKTGRPKTESEIRHGDYFRQLTFYALLIEEGFGILKPKAFILDFVGEGADHPVERLFEITEVEKRELRNVIGSVWEKITNLDFTSL